MIQRIEAPIRQKQKTGTISEQVIDNSSERATSGTGGNMINRSKGKQRLAKLFIILEARLPVLGKTAYNDPAEFGRDLFAHRVRRGGLLLKHFGDQLDELDGRIRRFAREQIVKRSPDGIDIRTHIELFAAELFGGRIRGRAHD